MHDGSDIQWWNWPDDLPVRVPKLYSVSLQFAAAPDAAAQARLAQSFAGRLGTAVTWEWLMRTAVIRVTSGGVDMVAALREAVAEAARIVPIQIAELRIPPNKAAKTSPASDAQLTVVERKPSELPSAFEHWSARHVPPTWMQLPDAPLHQVRLTNGSWLVLERRRGVNSVALFPTEGSAEHVRVEVGKLQYKTAFVVSDDERRVMVLLPKELLELDTASLAVTATVAIPRTPRDNNDRVDASWLAGDRFLVATETGVYILDRAGRKLAFRPCLDSLEMAVTADQRLALVDKSDGPFRAELFGICGDELRPLARMRKSGSPFALGNRLFVIMSPKKIAEVLGGDSLWERAFDQR